MMPVARRRRPAARSRRRRSSPPPAGCPAPPPRSVPRAALALAAVVWATACQIRPEPYDLFLAPPEQFDVRGKTVVVVPTNVPDELEERSVIGSELEALVLSSLAEAPFTVVPPREYATIWERLTQEAGGFFDPFTGERDEQQFEAAVAQLFRELTARFEPDALLYPELWIVEAPLMNGVAVWDGWQQQVYGAAVDEGFVLALSFVAILEDLDGRELFNNGRGITVYQWSDLLTDEVHTVPWANLADSPDHTATVVRETLAPLLAATAAEGRGTPAAPRPDTTSVKTHTSDPSTTRR